ncbi:MAG: response regulator [Planctomycetota bacterium]|jgi:DNA-binding response OmpR family regulator|nr:response regulator [Planctomycetota bacterium]
MRKILVRASNPDVESEIRDSLPADKYSVAVGGPPAAGASPAEEAKAIVADKCDVAILDYIADDAFSVKLMQAATDAAQAPHFIFVLPEDADLAHALMAVNEGAAAVVQPPLNKAAIANYVDRALRGPSRLRQEAPGEDANVEELEKQIRLLRQLNRSGQKLVSYLLATPESQQNRKALIVSDSPYQRDMLRRLLADHGFSVQTAENAERGLQTALDERPLVVVSDLEMDGMNGIEFCRALKIDNKLIPCHFVICTANQSKIEAVLAPGNGIDDCVVKPANENDNLEFLTRVALGLLLQSAADRSTRVFTPI